MITTPPVAPGTAENLARVGHFRDLLDHADGTDDPDACELDAVALFLIGDVGGAHKGEELWSELRHLHCPQLWHLITDDWDERDLDDPIDEDAALTPAQETDARHDRTVTRLVWEIEQRIHLARYEAADQRRAEARRQHKAEIEAAIHRHPAGSRIPAHLTGSNRRGGGHPLGDYLHLKGEGR